MSLKYKIGKNNIGFKGKQEWTNLSSKRYNVQPRYAMFHLIYRFAKQPKKK